MKIGRKIFFLITKADYHNIEFCIFEALLLNVKKNIVYSVYWWKCIQYEYLKTVENQ